MSDESELTTSIELTPESLQALQDLVADIDTEVEGFRFGKDAKAPTLDGHLTTFIAGRPLKMPISVQPKGFTATDDLA
ncbi:MAG: hypothetical protein ACE367_02085 [Acidimicrobiales bacterium]